MTTLQKQKGPASAPTLPSHGSTKSREGMEMNTHTDSTTPDIAARTVDLEDALHDLANMAAIASELITDDLGSSHAHITGDPCLYHLAPRQRDRMLFSVNHLRDMADDLLQAFNRNEVAA